ncbi:MAG: hypothetical protein KGL66_14700 [Alphaproteobacteria bacterium]|nr:hypothetical protein [Alphaproteobacteria bacterium]
MGLRGIIEAILDQLQPVRRDIARLESLAEAAYDAMYDAESYGVKDCYEDASSHLADAIALAKRAHMRRTAARLAARKEHIANVYNHQFRYAGR